MHIQDILKTGKENAITGRELADMLHCDIRKVTLMIEQERLSGVPICATCDSGYYLADKSSDLQEYINRLSKRAIKMLQTTGVLKAALAEMPDYDAEQIKILDGEEEDGR